MVVNAVIVTVLSYLLLGMFHWVLLLAVLIAHLGTDLIKAIRKPHTLRQFLFVQIFHLIVIAGLAVLSTDAAPSGWWVTGLTADQSGWYFTILSLISGLILAVPAGGILVGKATDAFREEISEDIEGLAKGGMYIGWLERFLVMLLLLIQQPTGIGFLIAAKSILRFGEIKNAKQRKVAEYIIIGTFLSFAWALTVAMLTQLAIQYWMPF